MYLCILQCVPDQDTRLLLYCSSSSDQRIQSYLYWHVSTKLITSRRLANKLINKKGVQKLRVCINRTEVIKNFSCSTQLSMKFQLIKTEMSKIKIFLAFKLSDVVFIMLIVGILTFMSMINFMSS